MIQIIITDMFMALFYVSGPPSVGEMVNTNELFEKHTIEEIRDKEKQIR